jgi:methionine synthase II (cobalamin-independent)
LKNNEFKSDWQALAAATLVGSMPHRDPDRVIDLILREIPEIPVWPQLPFFRFEQMMLQYLDGLPGLQFSDKRVFVRTDTAAFEQELYSFYEEYMEVEAETKDILNSRFKMGHDSGRTFFQFVKSLERLPPACRALKGQIVGPFTLLSGLKDQNDSALLYDERMRDVVPKHLAMKAKWQILNLKTFGYPVILFLDEPALAGFGSSAFISVSRELIQQLLKEVVDAAHQEGSLAGIHICANTDWLLAFDSRVDIINFDAYNYFDKFALYREAFLEFMAEGRMVAWGMVPTGDPMILEAESAAALADRWLKSIQELSGDEISLPKVLSQSLFTPSCGCGSLPEPMAERVVHLAAELNGIMRAYL